MWFLDALGLGRENRIGEYFYDFGGGLVCFHFLHWEMLGKVVSFPQIAKSF